MTKTIRNELQDLLAWKCSALQRYKLKGQLSFPKSSVYVNKVNINGKQNWVIPVVDFHRSTQVLKMAVALESISH